MNDETINAKYRDMRKQLGSQIDVAKILGVSRQTVCYRENGSRKIPIEAMLAMEYLIQQKQSKLNAPVNMPGWG